MSASKEGRNIGRIMAGVLLFQLVLGLLLFFGDLGRGFSLPSRGPAAPGFDLPVSPGDQTRKYDPAEMPVTGPGPSGPMPDRLVLEELTGAWRLTGRIAEGDAERIAAQLTERLQPETAAQAPDTLFLNSPGGAVAEALQLGRVIRDAGLSTDMGARDICLSACPYLLASGVTRSADTGARIGVHQHYFGENTLLPAFTAVKDIQRGQGQVMRYLQDMGVDPMLMSHGLLTPPDQIYLLSRDELETYALLTPDEDG
ncbi:COG3904 family protein [Pseudooceanicola algae]|uniref:Clp protease n=1 Tax=Pseudooceanicola algae TaxID=1537215 RepID=A0A418SCP2_9RHOB|nr:hypothetical protein [Pseudooceanicola algae]QPM90070.1 hypothetical protein PSAL_013040 [Pseudooceanicola algae]